MSLHIFTSQRPSTVLEEINTLAQAGGHQIVRTDADAVVTLGSQRIRFLLEDDLVLIGAPGCSVPLNTKMNVYGVDPAEFMEPVDTVMERVVEVRDFISALVAKISPANIIKHTAGSLPVEVERL